jgi:hypothetical protein
VKYQLFLTLVYSMQVNCICNSKYNVTFATLTSFIWLICIQLYLYHIMTLSLKLRCLSPLILCICIPRMEKCTTLCGIVCQWFSLGTLVSSANKTDCHDITEILLKVTLNTIKPTNQPTYCMFTIILLRFGQLHTYIPNESSKL